jgi:hypothetical protein
MDLQSDNIYDIVLSIALGIILVLIIANLLDAQKTIIINKSKEIIVN